MQMTMIGITAEECGINDQRTLEYIAGACQGFLIAGILMPEYTAQFYLKRHLLSQNERKRRKKVQKAKRRKKVFSLRLSVLSNEKPHS